MHSLEVAYCFVILVIPYLEIKSHDNRAVPKCLSVCFPFQVLISRLNRRVLCTSIRNQGSINSIKLLPPFHRLFSSNFAPADSSHCKCVHLTLEKKVSVSHIQASIPIWTWEARQTTERWGNTDYEVFDSNNL